MPDTSDSGLSGSSGSEGSLPELVRQDSLAGSSALSAAGAASSPGTDTRLGAAASAGAPAGEGAPAGTDSSGDDDLPPLVNPSEARRTELSQSESSDEELPPVVPYTRATVANGMSSATSMRGREREARQLEPEPRSRPQQPQLLEPRPFDRARLLQHRLLEPPSTPRQSPAKQPRSHSSPAATTPAISDEEPLVDEPEEAKEAKKAKEAEEVEEVQEIKEAKARVEDSWRAGDKSKVAAALLKLAEVQLRLERPDEALATVAEARGIYKEMSFSKGEAEALRVAVKVHSCGKRHFEAMNLAEEELRVFRDHGDCKAEAVMMLALCDVHLAQDRLVRAFQAAEVALELFRDVQDLEGEAAALQTMIGVYFAMSRWAKVVSSGQEALEKAELVGDKAGRAYLMRILSEAQNKMDRPDPDEALRWAKQALDIYEELGDKQGQAATLRSIAIANLCKPDSLAQAKRACLDARKVSRSIFDAKGEASALELLANYWMRRGEEDPQMEALDLALRRARDLDDVPMIGRLIDSIVRVFLANNPARARSLVEEEEELAKRADNPRREAQALRKRASVQLELQRNREAVNLFKEAIAKLQQVEDKAGEAAVHLDLAEVYMVALRYTDALDSIKDAEALFQVVDDTRGLVASLQAQVSLHLQHDSDLAIQAALQQSRVYKEAGYGEDEAGSLESVAELLLQLKGHREALDVAKEARKLYKELGDRRGEVGALLRISFLQANSQAPTEALRSATDAQKIAKDIGDIPNQAQALQAMAQVYAVKNFFGDAIRKSEEACKLCRQGGDRQAEAENLKQFAEVHMQIVEFRSAGGQSPNAKDLQDALEALQSSVKLFQSQGAEARQASALRLMASVLVARNEGERALEAAHESLEISTGIDDAQDVGSAYHSMAKVHLSLGDPEQAIDCAREAERMFQSTGDGHGIQSCTDIIASARDLSRQARQGRGPGRGDKTTAWEDQLAPGRQSVPVGDCVCGVSSFGSGAAAASGRGSARGSTSAPPSKSQRQLADAVPKTASSRGPQVGKVNDGSRSPPAQATGSQEVGFGRGPGGQLGWGCAPRRLPAGSTTGGTTAGASAADAKAPGATAAVPPPLMLGSTGNKTRDFDSAQKLEANRQWTSERKHSAFDSTGSGAPNLDPPQQPQRYRSVHYGRGGAHGLDVLPRRPVREVDGLD